MTLVIDASAAEGGRDPHAGGMPPDPPPRPPRAPRRPPRPPRPPLTRSELLARGILTMLAAVVVMFLLTITGFGHVAYLAQQQRLSDGLREQLVAGTAPVSELDFEDRLLQDGAPVAILDIPSIGVHDVVSEGTSASVLTSGPGHRRDTVLPGQAGVSVVMGRSGAFGGPFRALAGLVPGDRLTVRTGQGESTFEVLGTRYAGEAAPANPKPGEARVVFQTARGPALIPTGVMYVDTVKVESPAFPAGARVTPKSMLPPQDLALATDPRTVWALIFALQFLVVVEIAAVWSFRRFGAAKTWVVFAPLTLLAALLTATQVALLLPNLT